MSVPDATDSTMTRAKILWFIQSSKSRHAFVSVSVAVWPTASGRAASYVFRHGNLTGGAKYAEILFILS